MQLTRRAFLRLTAGNSLAVAVGGFGNQFPANWISAPLPPVPNVDPTELLRYATTCRECPAGCGMQVRHVNGRSIKAEGNPDHPVNLGGLCARGQSALQGLYDPDRLRRPFVRNRPAGDFPDLGASPVSWPEALRQLGGRLRALKGRAVVISGLETGALAAIMEGFAENFGGELLLFEPLDYRPLREVYRAAAGAPVIPWHDLGRCRTILSFTADFLESWVSNVQYTHMFTRMHDPAGGRMGTFAYVGPRLSMTAANADQFLQVPPSATGEVAMNILKIMADRGWIQGGDLDYRALTREFRPEDLPLESAQARLEKLAEDFAAGDGIALAGPGNARGEGPRRLAEAVYLLNRAAGNFGRTIDFGRVHALSRTVYLEELSRLAETLTADDLVIFHQANPVFVRPELAAAFRRAGTLVSLSQLPDETARLADILLPVDNPLESWGEYSPWTGIRGLLQPTMQRLHDSRPAGDIFLSLADLGGRPLTRPGSENQALDFASWLRADWQERLAPSDEPGQAIPRLLRQGFQHDRDRREPAPRPAAPTPPPAPAPGQAAGRHPAAVAELWLWPSIFFFDGRTANRGWLQEIPQPVSQIAWGSWADIHPAKAAALGMKDGDGLRLARGETEIQVPARLTTEIAEGVVGLALGQGHWALGEVAAGRGANGFALIGDGGFFGTVALARAPGLGPPITLAAEREQHEREILRWEKLARLAAGELEPARVDLPLPEGFAKKDDLYQGHVHAGHRWAMVIDLHRCIGCGACSAACYAENNIPVLGPGPLRDRRELSWLQVVPYRHPDKPGTLGFLPLPCQHCDQAPCEPVCPVFASVHTEDGLNAQVYNRCIGTRYCSQNCPYKVRRFNWLNTSRRPPLEWQLNPEVTVRSRGVMEKCTFCVQRIRRAEYRARREDRPVRDGEIVPACVATCPAKVFTFGDLQDEESAVARLFRREPRRYQLLHELNTKPAVLYLKKIEHG